MDEDYYNLLKRNKLNETPLSALDFQKGLKFFSKKLRTRPSDEISTSPLNS